MTELAGRTLVGEGREAEIFEWDEGRVLRLLRDPSHASRLATEAAAMRAAAACAVPVPAVGDVVTVDGRPGLVMTRIDGPDLITLMGHKPWMLPRAASMLGRIQSQLHDVIAPSELPSLREHVLDRIAAAPALPARLAEHAIATLETLPDGTAICHGDLHPGNVLLGRGGPVVIDWVNAVRGDPAADVARTRLMLRIGAIPPGSPAVFRVLQRSGRGYYCRTWLRTYRRRRPVDATLLDRWETVRAADRLSEQVEGEAEALLEILERSAVAAGR